MDIMSKEQRSFLMSRVGSKNTKPELIVRSIAHRLGYRYCLHRKDLVGKPDLTFPRLKKIINVNGCFWHMHACKKGAIPKSNVDFWREKLQRNAARDKANLKSLKRQGWSVLTVWECQIKNTKSLTKKLINFLGS